MKIIECPRDAWQGHHPFIPTEVKIEYINQLLRVGFDTIDFGSFVSATAMPQVRDTAGLIDGLDVSRTRTKLLAIVANERGAREACLFDKINCLGYPFSISETFQIRNTKSTIEESFSRVASIADICQSNNKQLVIYISMGFGNPYGDAWDTEVVLHWVEKLSELGAGVFSLADTVGVAREEDISSLFEQLIVSRPELEFGAHFHTQPEKWRTKIDAAYRAGCRRFDGAILGYGGCPMAQDDLVGNMPTEKLLEFAKENDESLALDIALFDQSRTGFLKLISA